MQHRQQQHRAGEDDRHDAALVDLQRDVGVLAAVHPPPDHSFGELHRDAPLGELDTHDRDDDQQADDDQQHEREPLLLLQDRVVAERQAADDRREDDHAHAVTDAALADELADPHQHRGSGDERRG